MVIPIKLENNFLEIEIIPELGGRVNRLINKKNKFDWVWKNDQLRTSKVDKTANYDQNWQGGWEELFPNDAIEEFSWGFGLDHGETWSHSWIVESEGADFLTLNTKNLESGSFLQKKYRLYENKLRTDYKIKINFEEIFLFKLHLAIPILENCKIIGQFENFTKVDEEFGNILNTNKSDYFLNPSKNSNLFDFAYIESRSNTLNIQQGENLLNLTYDDIFLNYLWLFQSQGGWNNHNVLVLEPSSNGKKLFEDALISGEYKKGPAEISTYYEVIIT